ncbi:MAG: FAD-binding oxidoreductase [Acidimicrobiales bacterium]
MTAPVVEVGDIVLARLQAVSPVDTDDAARAAAGRDWWPLALQRAQAGDRGHPALTLRPAVVVRPDDAEQVSAVLAVCHEARVPVTASGGRSGVCGASVPAFGGVSLDLRALAGVVEVDETSLLVEAGPGTYGHDLEAALDVGHGLTLGHWPQSMAISTLGGWLACRSAGQYSTRYGTMADMVAGLDVVLADGRSIRTGWRAPRSATGPDLTQLFVGSEGTLGVITSALLRVHPRPPARRQAALAFASFEDGVEACRRILRRGATPAVLRLYDEVESARSCGVSGRAVLIVLDETDPGLADAVAAVVSAESAAAGAEVLGDGPVEQWSASRHDLAFVDEIVASGLVFDTCEVAARWSSLPALYRRGLAALGQQPGLVSASAHLSHAYPDGACLYFGFAGQVTEDASADGWYRAAWQALMDAVVGAGGTISHHHGIGLHKGRFLASALGSSIAALGAVKAALDPRGILNPGKLGLPSPWGEAPWPA